MTSILLGFEKFAMDKRQGESRKFKSAVHDWVEYHDSLPDSYKNILNNMQGLILKSQLYRQDADLCSDLTKKQLKHKNGASLIVNAVYQRDALIVNSESFDGFNQLLTTLKKLQTLKV